MIPIFWKYLLKRYFQVFLLCVVCFIAILLVTRFQEIARFATTGAYKSTIFLFTLFLIPSILPIAIPISSLISSILLLQNLSRTNELTALRASGIKLHTLLFPLLLCGCLLSMMNFTLMAEILPKCHGLSKGLAYEMTSSNPLSLLQKDTLIKLKNCYFDMKVLKSGEFAKDVTLVMRNLSNQRMGLIVAKELSLQQGVLIGRNVSMISSLDSKREEGFDHLIIENQQQMKTAAADLSQFVRSHDLQSSYEHLNLRMVLAKMLSSEKEGKFFNRGLRELVQRASLSFAPFIFVLIGACFGMEIGRTKRKTGVIFAAALAGGFMICFAAAKSMKHSIAPSCLFYLLPYFILIPICLHQLKKIRRGIE